MWVSSQKDTGVVSGRKNWTVPDDSEDEKHPAPTVIASAPQEDDDLDDAQPLQF